MSKIISVLSLLLLLIVVTVTATPALSKDDKDGRGCLSDREASELLPRWNSLFEDFDAAVANEILTDDFQLISASLNFILAKPVWTPFPLSPQPTAQTRRRFGACVSDAATLKPSSTR